MLTSSDAAPDLLTAGRRRAWAIAVPLGLALLLGLIAVPGWMSARCQCRYTSVLFAERAGLERVVLPLEVSADRRASFGRAMKDAGIFVDPDWELGLTPGGPAIYVDSGRRPAALAVATAVIAMIPYSFANPG
jgi:hypothetical protein